MGDCTRIALAAGAGSEKLGEGKVRIGLTQFVSL